MVAMPRRMDAKPTIVGENLARLRAEKRLSQEEVAAKADLSRLSISNIERGVTAEPGRRTIVAIAKALGVSPDELEVPPAGGPVPEQQRVSLDDFLKRARPVLEPDDIRRLERLRTRFDPRGLTVRSWLRTVIDMREDTEDDDGNGLGEPSGEPR